MWTYPGCPLRILFNLRVLERLRAQIPPAPASAEQPKPRQLGGLLIGLKKSRSGITKIVDFVPLLASVDPTSSQFKFLPEWLDEVADRCPPDCKIVGYYRTSPDDSIRLTPEDLKLIGQRFADASNVFLVIAATSQGATAGFFCWHNGAVAMNSRLTFPFSADELAQGGWPIRDSWSFYDRFAQFAAPILHPTFRPGRWTKRVAAALVVLLFFAAGVVLRRTFAARAPAAAPPPAVVLHVQQTGEAFVLTWDPTLPQVASALGGNLEIHEGTKPASFLNLTPEQLRVGMLSYGSFPYSSQAEFKLQIIAASGVPLTASLATPSVEKAPLEEPGVLVATPEPPPRPAHAVSARLRDRSIESARLEARSDSFQPPPPPTRTASAKLRDRSAPPARLEARQESFEPVSPRPRPARKIVPAPAVVKEPVKNEETAELQKPAAVPEPPARPFVPPAARQITAASKPSPNIIAPEPPAGRLAVPPSTVGWTLANSIPVNQTAPPATENMKPAPMRVPVIAETAPGMVTITSEPSGASVQINDQLAGTTPLTLQLAPAGLGFTVVVTKTGFAKWTIQSVATDQPYALHARLRPK